MDLVLVDESNVVVLLKSSSDLETVIDVTTLDVFVSPCVADSTVSATLDACIVTAAVDIAAVVPSDVKLVVTDGVAVALVPGSPVVRIRSVVDSVVVSIEVDLPLVLVISGGPVTDVRRPEVVVLMLDVRTSVVGVVREVDVDREIALVEVDRLVVNAVVDAAAVVRSMAGFVLEVALETVVVVDVTSDVVPTNLVDFIVPTVLGVRAVVVKAAVDVAAAVVCDVKLVVTDVEDVALVPGSPVVRTHSSLESVTVFMEVDLLLVLVISGGPVTDDGGPEEVVLILDVRTSVVGVVRDVDVDREIALVEVGRLVVIAVVDAAAVVRSMAGFVLEVALETVVVVDVTSDVVPTNLVDFIVPIVLVVRAVVVKAAVDVAAVVVCDVKLVVTDLEDVALVPGSPVVRTHSSVESVTVFMEVDSPLVLVISGGPVKDDGGPEEVVLMLDVRPSVVGVVRVVVVLDLGFAVLPLAGLVLEVAVDITSEVLSTNLVDFIVPAAVLVAGAFLVPPAVAPPRWCLVM